MLQKSLSRIILISSLLLFGITICNAQNKAAEGRTSSISKLHNGTLLVIFPKNESYIKALENNPQLKNRIEEKLQQQAADRDSILEAFKTNYTFSKVVYITANADDIKAVKAGDYSSILNLDGKNAQLSPNSIEFVLYPFTSKNEGANSSSSGFTIEFLDSTKRLPKGFPSNVLKFDGLKFADLDRNYIELVTILQKKLDRYLEQN